LPISSGSQAKSLLRRWADPVLFSEDVFGITPWARQVEILRTVAAHPRVAVRSGHKVSKSNSALLLAYWWIVTRPGGRVVLTSSSSRQVKEILWHEAKALYRRARVPLGGELNSLPGSGLSFPDGRQIVGFSTDEPERMAGFSGANLLFILDEASGIPEEIFQAVEGNRAGGARVVLFSNPTRTSGTFYDAFNTKARFWKGIHVSSEETPNVTAGRVLIPGLATAEWVAEKREEWGPDYESSPLYQVRVRGEFPSQADNAVIGLALIGAAQKRQAPATGPLSIGVDVARFGDDASVIQPIRGLRALPAVSVRGQDSIQVAGKVLEVVRSLRQGDERVRVKVDVIGVGSGVYDQLAAVADKNRLDVVAVDVASRAHSEDYANLRAELWFRLKRWLASGSIPEDAELVSELVAPTYGFDTSGRILIEPKDKIKARLGHSPDRAEALMLAAWDAVSPAEVARAIQSARREMPARTQRATL
jgi:phage terminase large subunit